MGATLIERILADHAETSAVQPGDIVEIEIDARIARDFGGANVVRNLQGAGLGVADPERTWFTFDCNPGGSDQKYAANQHRCRLFAAEQGFEVFDIDQGIGTHVALEQGLVWPGATLVSTDSHANIMGAIGAFGQGMGDADIAAAFARGRVWFAVPPTVRVEFRGRPAPGTTAKDLALAAAGQLGADGLLGCAAELVGEPVESLDLDGRITLASMATEMGGIIALIPPNEEIVAWCRQHARQPFEPARADPDATYERELFVDVEGLTPRVARPGHPDDVVGADELPATRVDSVFIGSCTNGRISDLRAAAEILEGRKLAPGVVLKVVPATDATWRQALEEGLWERLKAVGALVGNAGCAGCAAGQIGQNGPGEVTVSTGNRNFPGKQGQGAVYLASPATAAASAVAGMVVSAERLRQGALPERPAPRPPFRLAEPPEPSAPAGSPETTDAGARPLVLEGRAWLVDLDSIDTDMIYHNRHLAETDPERMGRYAFGNLPGHTSFPQEVQPGDLVFTGANFGCGSSRQQAVTCFQSLGVSGLVARSYGAIYERNAINAAFPVLVADWSPDDFAPGDRVRIDLETGRIRNLDRDREIRSRPPSQVQLDIYRRGGLLRR